MPKGETKGLLLFMVPRAHCFTTLNGCHWDTGHQVCDHTPSLLEVYFWWTGMTNQMQQSIRSCTCCLQHEGDLSKVPLHPIVAITPLDLLHVDFTSIEMALELNRPPKVANVLVFQDHFTKHVMAYVSPNQATKRVTTFLYQGYILIFGPQTGSCASRVQTSWTALFMRCVNSSTWRNYEPCLIIPRQMGWWKGLIKPLCRWLGSWEKIKKLTDQVTWLR